jgi:FAD synthase
MVFEGAERDVAAVAAGITDHALRQALLKPHVLAYLNEQKEVLRTSLQPRALHTMGKLLKATAESVQFKAAEYLDGQNRGTHTIGATTVNIQMNQSLTIDKAGYVIDLTADGGHAPQISDLQHVEVNQLETFDDVAEDE